MSNQLTKADAARKRREKNPTSLTSALKNGGPLVWISCLIMGFGNIMAGQVIKGLLFLAIEIGAAYLLFTPLLPGAADGIVRSGLDWIKMLPSLGNTPDAEMWDDNEFVYKTIFGDRSHQILLYAVLFICMLVLLAVIWRASVRSGYMALSRKKAGKKPLSFWGDIKELFDSNIHKLLMFFPFACLVVFTIIPLVYMICMAFTNYSNENFSILNPYDNTIISEYSHQKLFDWVGFDTFKQLFSSNSVIAEQFWSVLAWTLVWAVFATFLNFFLGTFVAMVINRPTTRFKSFWRTVLSFTVAVPQFVSLLIIGKMFADNGIINKMLIEWGFSEKGVHWYSTATNARIFVIIINLWVGIPYTVMQVTGILKNIPADLYEAARIDGANAFQQFVNITLPYMIFVMTPTIIGAFTGNINNFNVIFLLTGGGPFELGANKTAGQTDLLVTWLYRLSMEKYQYNLAAVIGIFTFIVLAIVSLVTYRSSGSYKDEEGFK